MKKKELEAFLLKVPKKYRKRIVLHSYHGLALKHGLKGIHLTEDKRKLALMATLRFVLFRILRPGIHISASFHRLKEIKKERRPYTYVFLSPVFESISKQDYKPTYNMATIYEGLQETSQKVVALGGVDDTKITLCKEGGFYGIALLGYIWQAADPVETLKNMLELCPKNVPQY
jgi:thiamine-phosphate pyrophosphorylase